jgi:drug/metabolite transporter (DMT)-like permease
VTAQKNRGQATVAAGLFFAVFLWGGNNTGVKYLVKFWPPIFTGCTRFLVAGLLFCALLRWTRLFGQTHGISRDLNHRLWWRGGLSLALYTLVFNWALKLSSVSHVTLYLGAAPVWALLWEGRPEANWRSVQRYGAAALAFSGVAILLWPSVHGGAGNLPGELLGVACGILWPLFGLQCRELGRDLTGAEVSAQTFWRAGILLVPFSLVEISMVTPPLRTSLLLVQLFCIIGGGIVAFAFWNGALRFWKTSQVYLFNNLVPVSSMLWAHYCLGERITATFWGAMLLIGAGVLLGQANWQKIFGRLWLPTD